jgi:outer membrane protein, heavy metal efflux system
MPKFFIASIRPGAGLGRSSQITRSLKVNLRRFIVPGALVLSWGCFGQTGPHADPATGKQRSTLTVGQAVAEALEANPDIRAAVRRVSLAQIKTTTAHSLDDPTLMVRDWQTPLRKPWDLNQAQLMFMVQQTFPNREKRDMRARVAGDSVELAAADLETMRQEVVAVVRKTCVDLTRNADALRLHDHQAALLKEALAAALAEYTTGKVSQADVLRAQMAVTRLNEHMIELEQERDSTRAQLDALLGRRPDEVVEISGSYSEPAAVPSIEALESAAIEHRPELAALRKQIAAAQDESHLARMATKPDFTVGLGYMLMPTGSTFRNAYMAEFSMNMPRFNRDRHDQEAKQADAATAVTQAELDTRTTAVFLEVRQAQIDLLAAQKRVKLYRDTLLPQADAAFKAATAAYQHNRAEFGSLIESQNLLLDVQTAFYNAEAAVDTGVARLERATGAPLSTPAEKEAGK